MWWVDLSHLNLRGGRKWCSSINQVLKWVNLNKIEEKAGEIRLYSVIDSVSIIKR